MADNFNTQFLISVKVAQLKQVRDLYNLLVSIKDIAGKGTTKTKLQLDTGDLEKRLDNLESKVDRIKSKASKPGRVAGGGGTTGGTGSTGDPLQDEIDRQRKGIAKEEAAQRAMQARVSKEIQRQQAAVQGQANAEEAALTEETRIRQAIRKSQQAQATKDQAAKDQIIAKQASDERRRQAGYESSLTSEVKTREAIRRASERKAKQDDDYTNKIGRLQAAVLAKAEKDALRQATAATAYSAARGSVGITGLVSPVNEQSAMRQLGVRLRDINNAQVAFAKTKAALDEADALGLDVTARKRSLVNRAISFGASQDVYAEFIKSSTKAGFEKFKPFEPLVKGYEDAATKLKGLQAQLGPVEYARNVANTPGLPSNIADRYRSVADSRETRLKAKGIDTDALRQATKEYDAFGQALVQSGANLEVANKQFEKHSTYLQRFKDKFTQLSYYAGAATIIYGIAQGIRTSITELVKFESELTRIQGFFRDKSLNSRLIIEQGTINAARDFGATLDETVRTAKYFAQAGYGPTQAIQETRATLRAASGLGITPEEAASTAISVKNVSGGTVSSEDIFNRIARIEAQNAVTAEDLNTAIQRLGAFVQQLQPRLRGAVDAFDLVIGATTQIVETTRVSGNQAATALRFITARLVAPEIENKLQNQYGIKFAANKEGTELRPLQDILTDIAATYKGLKAQGRTVEAERLLVTLAGGRQVGIAAALFDHFNEALKVATESSLAFGDLDRRLALQLDTVQKRFEQFNASFFGFLNKLGEETGGFSLTKLLLQGSSKGLQAATESPFGATLTTLAGVVGLGAVGKGIKGAAGLLKSSRSFGGLSASETLVEGVEGAKVLQFGKSIGILGRLFAGIEAIFGVLSIPVVLAGLAALAAAITFAIRHFSGNYGGAEIKQLSTEDLNKTQIGQEYGDIATKLATTRPGISDAITAALRDARQHVIDVAETSDDPRIKILKSQVDDIIAGKYQNTKFGNIYEAGFIQSVLKRFPEIKTLVGPQPNAKAQSDAEANFALELLRRTAQYQNAPSEFVKQQGQDEVSRQLEQVIGARENALQILRSPPKPDAAGKFGTIPKSSLDIFDKLKDAFGGFAPTKDSFDKFKLTVDKNNTTMSASEALLKEFNGGISNAGAAFDKFVKDFFVVGPESKVSPREAALNRQTFVQSLVPNIERIANIGEIKKGNVTPGAVQETSGRTGEIAFNFVVDAAKDALVLALKSVRTPQAAQNILNAINALAKNREAYRSILQNLDVIATARDRLAEVLIAFAQNMQQAAASAEVYKQAGIGFDLAGRRYSAVKTFVDQFTGVTGALMADIARTELQLAQASSVKHVGNQTFAIDETGQETEVNDIAYQAITQGRGANFIESQGIKLGFLNQMLEVLNNPNLKILEGLAPDSPVRKYINKPFQDILGKQPDGSDRTIEFLKDINNSLPDLLKISKAFADAIDFALINQDRLNDVLREQTSLTFRLTNVSRASRIRQLQLFEGPRGALRERIGAVRTERQQAVTNAQLAYQDRLARIAIDTRKEDQAQERQKAANELKKAVAEAYNDATVNLAQLLADERNDIISTTIGNIRQAITTGTGGLKNFLLTATSTEGPQTTKGAFRQIIEPIGGAIRERSVTNTLDILTGTGGIFEKSLIKFFGVSDKIRQQRELQKVQRDATYDGVYDAMTDLGLGKTTKEPGQSRSGNVNFDAIKGLKLAPLIEFGGVGAANILGGGYSRGGPNAGANPVELAAKKSRQDAKRLSELDKKAKLKELKDQALLLAGQYGGSLLGQAVGKGKYSYANEGASIGTGLGSLLGGPVGGLLGGLAGGLLGGLFGKSKPPKPPREPTSLEKIERNTRAAVTALENQNRMLFNLDSRLLNVPATFTVPGYRPTSAGAGNSTVYNSNTYQLNITGNNPQEIAQEVQKVLKQEQRRQGSFVSARHGL